MILTTNNDPTRKLSPDDIRLLSECDRVSDYNECGWFCVLGWKGDKRLVHVHANSRDEVVRLAARHGFRYTGHGLVALTPEERRDEMDRFSYRGDYQKRSAARR